MTGLHSQCSDGTSSTLAGLCIYRKMNDSKIRIALQMLTIGFSGSAIARALKVSRKTLRYSLGTFRNFTSISDEELDSRVKSILDQNPNTGQIHLLALLHARVVLRCHAVDVSPCRSIAFSSVLQTLEWNFHLYLNMPNCICVFQLVAACILSCFIWSQAGVYGTIPTPLTSLGLRHITSRAELLRKGLIMSRDALYSLLN
jgi:transposase-like protein